MQINIKRTIRPSYISIMMLLTLTFFYSDIVAQKGNWQPLNREVTVTCKDSVVTAHILLQKLDIKASDKLVYHWFGQNSINHNLGGYSGQLLHGGYSVFDNNNNLITKGDFDKGLKVGQWKTWDSKGMLKTILEYKHGLAHGKFLIFDTKGDIIETRRYRNGKLLIGKEKKEKEVKKEERDLFRLLRKPSTEKDSIVPEQTTKPIEFIDKK